MSGNPAALRLHSGQAWEPPLLEQGTARFLQPSLPYPATYSILLLLAYSS